MSWFDKRPWLAQYTQEDQNRPFSQLVTTLDLLRESVAAYPDRTAVKYYGYEPSWRELNDQCDAFAAYLLDHGFRPGDRLGIYLQNTPHYHIAAFGTWKAGGVVVPLNPMYRDELAHIFSDAGVSALVVSKAAYLDRVHKYTTELDLVLTCADDELQQTGEETIFGMFAGLPESGQPNLLDVLADYRGTPVPDPGLTPADTGIIAYTSGTSGRSKGAQITHGNLTTNAQMIKDYSGYGPEDTVFTLAPVFHITGFVCQFLAAVACGAPLSMNYRFDPAVTLRIFSHDQPKYMAGPATAFMALLAHPDCTADSFASFRSIMSGGAPLPEAIVKKFEDRTGHYIGQGYGLTETTAQCVVVPPYLRSPVDPQSGNLSCGLPLPNAMVRVRDDAGQPVGPREVGEICVRGPMVTSNYINNPAATAQDIPDGELHTGDVGFMDEDGWVYIVDRKKDMINASGFKVWPREVEDVLYTIPEVLEAAVVGVPDDYRGEDVVAFVSLQPGAQIDEEAIISHCREHLASYKAPRQVTIIEALPKTSSGKILRREMRATARAEAAS